MCDHCKGPIEPGTGKMVWDKFGRVVRVCALCGAFAASAIFGQASPTQEPPPILYTVGPVAPNTTTATVMTSWWPNYKP
jgi:hypothetical protein